MTQALIILFGIIVLAVVLAYLFRQQIKYLYAKQQAKREKERQEREAEKARLEQERLQREAEERERKRKQKEAAYAILQDHAEERRVFYVAITRAKRASYVLFDKQYPSLFVTELGGMKEEDDIGGRICPRCGKGKLMFTKDGYAKNGHFYTVRRCTNKECDLKDDIIFFDPRKEPYEVLDLDQFLKRKRVTYAEQAHISVGTSPDFTNPVLLIPCAAESPQGLALTLDPRYDRYDLGKFYTQHVRQNDLAVCIQHNGSMERYLLTIRKTNTISS